MSRVDMKKILFQALVLFVFLGGCSLPEKLRYPMRRVYMPFAATVSHSNFGVQIEGDSLANRTQFISGEWVSVGINWNWAEPAPGVYNIKPLLAELDDYRLLVNVRNAPAWARSGVLECSGVATEHYQDYANFVNRLIDLHPNIAAVELWNEPDAYHTAPDLAPYIGCFESGQKYAEFVCAVSPLIRLAHPEITIVAGAFVSPGPFAVEFIENCSDYDVLSFHHYEWYNGGEWDTVKVAKDMASLTTKPVWMTETALLCSGECGSGFEQMQAQYLFYAAHISSLSRVFWYTLGSNGWNNSDLVWNDIPKPAWYQYQKETQWQKKER
jgi:hypothetical protein